MLSAPPTTPGFRDLSLPRPNMCKLTPWLAACALALLLTGCPHSEEKCKDPFMDDVPQRVDRAHAESARDEWSTTDTGHFHREVAFVD